MLVFLRGYQAWTRHFAYWSSTTLSWGESLTPWGAIIGVLLLFAGWVCVKFWKNKMWSLEIADFQDPQITNGIASVVEADPPKEGLMKYWLLFLNYI